MTFVAQWTDVGEPYQGLVPGRHVISLTDFVAMFGSGPAGSRRSHQVKDLLDYLTVLSSVVLVVSSVLVDGSFATQKPNPGDMDISPVIDGQASVPVPGVAAQVSKNYMHPKDLYKSVPVPGLGRTVDLDIYGFPTVAPGHPHYDTCRTTENYWRTWWQRTRANGMGSKGYLEVMIP